MSEFKIKFHPFIGLDTYSENDVVKDGYAVAGSNFITQGGILKSDYMGADLMDSDNYVDIIPHYATDNSTELLFCTKSNTIINKDKTVLKQGFDLSNIDYSNYLLNDTAITVVCNSINPPIKYDGQSFSDLGGNPPTCSIVVLHNERLFMSGDSSHPNRVYYSNAFNIEQWDSQLGGGYIDIPSFDGGIITGVTSLYSDLLVFKEYSLYRIYGTYPGEFAVEKVGDYGCIHNKALSVGDNKCFFFSRSAGLCVYDGMSTYIIDNNALKGQFKDLNYDSLDELRVITDDDKILIEVPFLQSGKYPQEQLAVYCYRTGLVFCKTAWQIKEMCKVDNQILFVDRIGWAMRFAPGNESNLIRSLSWVSKQYALNSPDSEKMINKVSVVAKGEGTLNIIIKTDRWSYAKYVTLSNDYQVFNIYAMIMGKTVGLIFNFYGALDCHIKSAVMTGDVEEE